MSCNFYGAKCCVCPTVDVFPALKAGVEITDDSRKRIVANNQKCTTTTLPCNSKKTALLGCTTCKTTKKTTDWYTSQLYTPYFSR